MQNKFLLLTLGLLHQRLCRRGEAKGTQSAACRALPSGTSCLAQTWWQVDKLPCVVKQINGTAKVGTIFKVPFQATIDKKSPSGVKHPVELSLRFKVLHVLVTFCWLFSIFSSTQLPCHFSLNSQSRKITLKLS